MNQENTKYLFETFPFFKPNKPLTHSLMGFGFECGDGWFELIKKLCEDIQALNRDKDFEVMQVKEKYGSLRFYCYGSDDAIYDLIEKAEKDSETICENCGKIGSIDYDAGWLSCRCEECQ